MIVGRIDGNIEARVTLSIFNMQVWWEVGGEIRLTPVSS